MDSETLVLFPIWYVIFLLSTVCHEGAHALAAKLMGDETAANQVTLNPVPHIRREPFGMVLVPILSFLFGGWMIGWASAPYDPYWQRRYPHRAAKMALAGPAANFSLVLIAAIAIHAGIAGGFLRAPGSVWFQSIVDAASPGFAEGVAAFLSILFSLNLLLGSFNLLPVPPLDGNTAIGLLLPERVALRFAELSHDPTFSLVGLLVAWYGFGFVFRPIFNFALAMLY
jgi:Zn-dependent protease